MALTRVVAVEREGDIVQICFRGKTIVIFAKLCIYIVGQLIL